MSQSLPSSSFSDAITSNIKEIDIYSHLKQSIRNLDTNCKCTQPDNPRIYCMPCKTLICQQCNFENHQTHNTVNKSIYKLTPENVKHLFTKYDEALQNNDLINSYESKVESLKNSINDTFNNIITDIENLRKIKLNELQKVATSLKTSILNFNSKLNEIKTNLTNFHNNNSKFFNIPNNNDETNSIFLLNYDIITTANNNYDNIATLFDNISTDFDLYENNFSLQFKQLQTSIHNVLYTDNEAHTKQKLSIYKEFTKQNDENILLDNRMKHPDLHLEHTCNKLNSDIFNPLNQRIDLLTKQINKTKNNVYTSYLQHKNLKHIEQINTSYENSIKTGIDTLFANRKTLTKLNSFNTPNNRSQFKLNDNLNKDDVQLNNITIQKHFAFLLMDIYSKHFKPLIKKNKLQHSEFILNTEEAYEYIDSNDIINNNNNIARVIEDTNEISLYDKKKRSYTKKQINLMKIPHGYTKFPIGCRWILIGDKLYISGGKAPKKTYANVLVYDIKNESIKRISDLNVARSCHTMAYVDVFNTLMVIGGEQCNSVEVFDVVSMRWFMLPSLNHPRAHPFFYLNKPQGMLYTMYGIEGKITSNVFSDVVEVLDLANIKKGWKVLNVKNNIGTSLKTHLCVFPIDLQDKILVYGCMKKRKLNKMVFVFDMGKNEYVHIDQTLYDELAEEAKTNKTLSYIVSTIHLHK